MGVLPLEFKKGESAETLKIKGNETFDISGIQNIKPLSDLTVRVKKDNGEIFTFDVVVRLDSDVDIEYYQNGGILHTVLRKMLNI